MFAKIVLFLALLNTAVAKDGHETGNGGDNHLGRYLLAQHIAEVTMRRVSENKLKEIFPKVDLFNLVSAHMRTWPRNISELQFTVTDKMLFEDGKEKAAISTENSNEVVISTPYFEKYNPGLDEVIINVIHEAGHKLGIRNHRWPDEIGSGLVTKVYKYFDVGNEWQQYLRIDRGIKAGFDGRLKIAAKEYLKRGDGLDLAYMLYSFTKHRLMNSNLSQLFKYMAKIALKVDIKTYHPQDWLAYYRFELEAQGRFIKELALYVRDLSPEDGLLLIKYGMAKLKIQGLLYTESSLEFDFIAKDLHQILCNRSVDMNQTAVTFAKYTKGKFYLYLFDL